ncbi:MAG TPA: hypothetical protein VK966_13505, partial [Longimicrobiales bacterium]|nr:hypothetical protein [Longimicrobiales bacterium]
MFATCTFCAARLGENPVVEAFPVGRRLAFDADRGRLWALCLRCQQWNLAPLEERWEALETLERTWRDTPQRYSTGEIGLAKHREGLELVRIGRPTRPEYAAWRYGTELLRRRRRALALGTLGVAAGAVVLGGIGAGMLAGGAFQIINLGVQATHLYRASIRTAARVEGPDGRRMLLRDGHAKEARLFERDGAVRLCFHYLTEDLAGVRAQWKMLFRRGLEGKARMGEDRVTELEGDAAIRAAGRILPAINRRGATRYRPGRRPRDAPRPISAAGSSSAAAVTTSSSPPRRQAPDPNISAVA